jgi:hypothetical protein
MAASNDTAALLVALEAKLDKFEKAMDQAYGSADRAVRKIEDRFKQANLTFGKLFGATAAGSFISQALSDPLQLAINKARELGDEFSKTAGLAKFLQTSIGRVQEVQFAFQLGGGSFDTFRTSSEQFLRNAEEAKRALDQVGTLSSRNINKIENDFARLFRANKELGVSLTDSTGNLKSWDDLLADASTLISNAKTELEKVQIAEMLGLSREWVKVLEEGPEKFKKIAASAREAGAVLDDSLIKSAKEFDRAWDRSMTRFKARFKQTIAEFPDAWARVVESLKAGLNLFPRLMINPGELGFGTNRVAGGRRRCSQRCRKQGDLERERASAWAPPALQAALPASRRLFRSSCAARTTSSIRRSSSSRSGARCSMPRRRRSTKTRPRARRRAPRPSSWRPPRMRA